MCELIWGIPNRKVGQVNCNGGISNFVSLWGVEYANS